MVLRHYSILIFMVLPILLFIYYNEEQIKSFGIEHNSINTSFSINQHHINVAKRIVICMRGTF